jgi:sodium/proline symporter
VGYVNKLPCDYSYTIYGGFQSVVYTDVVQALVMIFTLTVGPIVGLFYLANHPDVYSISIVHALESASPTHASVFNGLKGAAAGMFLVGDSAGFWVFGWYATAYHAVYGH